MDGESSGELTELVFDDSDLTWEMAKEDQHRLQVELKREEYSLMLHSNSKKILEHVFNSNGFDG
ncbi:unnamed protein product [Arabidopsis thaliana]|uniref:Uncharacterized protein n=1 Tax=Arabidopsis thaliana TaxID=3702 RepID=A0A654EFG9_ARATH|nr:unnamed protein product [Arabidopsis thaliana]